MIQRQPDLSWCKGVIDGHVLEKEKDCIPSGAATGERVSPTEAFPRKVYSDGSEEQGKEELERMDALRLRAFLLRSQNPEDCAASAYFDVSPGAGGLASKLHRLAHGLLLAAATRRVLVVSAPLRYVDPWRCPGAAWECTFLPLSEGCGMEVQGALQLRKKKTGRRTGRKRPQRYCHHHIANERRTFQCELKATSFPCVVG